MRLYSSPLSPFGMRVTIALRAKGVDVERPPLPAAGIKSPEFLALNPLGRIPVLVLDSGMVVPESTAILDFLESRYPAPSLWPVDLGQRAHVDVVCRIMDTYVMAPVIRLFPQLNPATRDPRIVEQELARLTDGLAVLAHFMQTPLPAVPGGISMADCVLPPSLHLSARIAMMLELPENPWQSHAVLANYYATMKQHPVVGPIIREMTQAQAAKDLKAGLPSLADRH